MQKQRNQSARSLCPVKLNMQFHIAGKSENPITTVYFAGADADDLAVCRPGCEALALRVAQFPDSPTVKLPEGTAFAQTLSAAGNLIAR